MAVEPVLVPAQPALVVEGAAPAAAVGISPPAEVAEGAAAASPPVEVAAAAPAVVAAAPAGEVVPPAEVAKPVEGEKPALVSETPSLLETVEGEVKPKVEGEPVAEGDKPKVDPAKPAEVAVEAKPVEGEKPAEVVVAEPEKPAPIDWKYTLPENVKLPDAMRSELHGVLEDFRAKPEETAQKLVDFHVARMNDYAQQVAQDQHAAFNKTREGWRTAIQADEIMGGSAWDTTRKGVARMRDKFISLEAKGGEAHTRESNEFNEFLRVTGAGDHPAFWRYLNNMRRVWDEPAAPPAEIKPVPNGGGRGPGDRAGKLYDRTKF